MKALWYLRAVLALPIAIVALALLVVDIALWWLAHVVWPKNTPATEGSVKTAAGGQQIVARGQEKVAHGETFDFPHQPTEAEWHDLGRPRDDQDQPLIENKQPIVDFGDAAHVAAVAIVENDTGRVVTRVDFPELRAEWNRAHVGPPKHQPTVKERFLAAVVDNVGRSVYRVDEQQASFIDGDGRPAPQVH